MPPAPRFAPSSKEIEAMTDLVVALLGLGGFAALALYVRLCERI